MNMRLSGGWRTAGQRIWRAVAIVTLLITSPSLALLAQEQPAAPASHTVAYYFPLLLEPIPSTQTYTTSLIGGEAVAVAAPKATATAPALAAPEAAGAAPSVSVYCPDIVQRVGDRLMLNGEPFTFVGTNVSYLLEDYFPESEVPGILSYLAESGCTALRVWLFPQHDLDRAERLLDLANQHDLRLVVTLVNYYYDKGAWWFDPSHYGKEYLPHVRQVVNRFKDRPEILAWELMNEPNCSTDTTGACPGNMVRWATAVSAEIKAIDPCHLITTGTIRIDPNEEHYRNLHAIETIDIVSVHKNADLWLQREIDIAQELAKPVLLGEIYARGYDKGCGKLYDGVLQDRAELVDRDMQIAWQQGVDGYLLWQYGHGRLVVGDQIQHYCNGYDYLRGDPTWDRLQTAPVSRQPIENS